MPVSTWLAILLPLAGWVRSRQIAQWHKIVNIIQSRSRWVICGSILRATLWKRFSLQLDLPIQEHCCEISFKALMIIQPSPRLQHSIDKSKTFVSVAMAKNKHYWVAKFDFIGYIPGLPPPHPQQHNIGKSSSFKLLPLTSKVSSGSNQNCSQANCTTICTNTQVQKYTNSQIHKCTYTQVQKYTNAQIHMCTNTKVHKYTSAQI